MEKVSSLLAGWEYDAHQAKQESEAKKNKKAGIKNAAPEAEDDDENNGKLFDESSDEEDNNEEHIAEGTKDQSEKTAAEIQTKNLFGDSDDDDDEDDNDGVAKKGEDDNDGVAKKDESETPNPAVTGKDLFGDDSSSDEELVPSKRGNGETDDEDAAPSKKRKIAED